VALEFRKGIYISRIWFLHHCDARADVMAQLWRELPHGEWHFDYRFRYYVDNQAHDSADRKSAYKGTFRLEITEAEILTRIGVVLPHLCEVFGHQFGTPPWEIDCCEIGTDEPRDVIRLLSLKPWAQLKIEPLKE
jgi:hypothetical protein